ncbi:Major Facilitator Superfamily protein [Micromonospora echinaurantiaca]|uniref:Major Facilitator Superfamily protein n=1 Tax=Micromonospora echinaurantiaca TaxID=47857 RepID=A0A1C5HPQ4_9ACTN|nr:MFS transporter [Micromonospora echinaurantiaca]SCG48010.1 Major Facilitator Superfamily protein [Micromonospora echinaurantiaca]
MTPITARVPDPRVRRLAATLYGYAFLSELVLLYPVYALLFSDTGLSVWQISSLFVIWSASSILLEVPSGAWADAVSRRLLLCLAPLVSAAAFALWVIVPSYPAFAVGFVLWGAGGALASGALEALVFTELDRLGAAGRYARTIGRARTAETLAVLASIVLAAPVLAAGGYPAVGAASVLACLLAAAVATRFPEHRTAVTSPAAPLGAGPTSAAPTSPASGILDDLDTRTPEAPVSAAPTVSVLSGPGTASPDTAGAPDPAGVGEPEEDDLGWWASLRAGLAEVRADPAVRSAVLLVAAVTAVWGALDEYTPLLARDTGVAAETVPLLLLLTWVGVSVGGLLAPAGERLGRRGQAALLAFAGLALAAGALLGRPVGFVLVGLAFCGFQLASVLAEARLQARITGPGRATVTSLAGMATDLTIIVVYAGYGVVATAAGNGVAFAVAAAVYPLLAVPLALGGRRRGAPAPGRGGRRAAAGR